MEATKVNPSLQKYAQPALRKSEKRKVVSVYYEIFILSLTRALRQTRASTNRFSVESWHLGYYYLFRIRRAEYHSNISHELIIFTLVQQTAAWLVELSFRAHWHSVEETPWSVRNRRFGRLARNLPPHAVHGSLPRKAVLIQRCPDG